MLCVMGFCYDIQGSNFKLDAILIIDGSKQNKLTQA